MVSKGNVEGVGDLLARSSFGKIVSSIDATLLDGHNTKGQTNLNLSCMRHEVFTP
jgi:hypothetical protein